LNGQMIEPFVFTKGNTTAPSSIP